MRVDAVRPYFLLAILLGALALVVLIFKPFLAPLALAAIFAVILRPVYRGLARYTGSHPGIASLLTLLFAVVCFLVPLILVATQVAAEARALYATLATGTGLLFVRELATQAAAFVTQVVPGVTIDWASITADLESYVGRALEVVISNIGGLLSSATALLLNLFVFFIALYFLLKDGPALKRRVIELSPLYDTDDEFIFKRLETAINSVVKGSLLIGLIQGAVATVGFFLFGVPNPMLWGTVTAIAALLPGLGPSLVWAPAVLYLFFSGATLPAIGLLLWGLLAVGLIDNMLYPKLIGSQAHLHPLLVFLAVLGGLIFFGVAGVFLGPLAISLFLAILAIHAHTLVRQ